MVDEAVHAVTLTLGDPGVSLRDASHFATAAGSVLVRARAAVTVVVFREFALTCLDLGAVLGDAGVGRTVRAGDPVGDA